MSEEGATIVARSNGRHYPKVEVLILNWNLWEMTIECLKSLNKSTYTNWAATIIDNGSSNDSVRRISDWVTWQMDGEGRPLEDRVKVVVSDQNLGYTGGNNLGIKMILEKNDAEFVLLLNNDVVLGSDAVELLLEIALSNTSYALLGPKILQMDSPDKIQCKGARVSKNFVVTNPIGFGRSDSNDSDGAFEVDAVYGACMLASVISLRRIGGFDETIRFYGEDIDLCLRARTLGYKVGCVPKARVWHKGEASTKCLGVNMRFNNGRGRAILLKRYAPLEMRVLYPFLRLPRELGAVINCDRSVRSVLAYVRGYVSASLGTE